MVYVRLALIETEKRSTLIHVQSPIIENSSFSWRMRYFGVPFDICGTPYLDGDQQHGSLSRHVDAAARRVQSECDDLLSTKNPKSEP